MTVLQGIVNGESSGEVEDVEDEASVVLGARRERVLIFLKGENEEKRCNVGLDGIFASLSSERNLKSELIIAKVNM